MYKYQSCIDHCVVSCRSCLHHGTMWQDNTNHGHGCLCGTRGMAQSCTTCDTKSSMFTTAAALQSLHGMVTCGVTAASAKRTFRGISAQDSSSKFNSRSGKDSDPHLEVVASSGPN